MPIRALLFDLKVFAPVEINYQRAFDLMAKEFANNAKSAPQDIFKQICLVKAKSSAKDYYEFSKRMSSLLDEIETSQVENVQLNSGVKNGLELLESMNVSVVSLSQIGVKATEKLLAGRGVAPYVDEVIARQSIDGPNDLVTRLNGALQKLNVKVEECVFFCNKLSDLKEAKSAKFRTVVLPSKGERLDLMMLENPDGVILFLTELQNLLSLELARSSPTIAGESTPMGESVDMQPPYEGKSPTGSEEPVARGQPTP